ncbi:unnamed protein product [Protopolystoma xenopodis]|uniref:Uncharacterized protein n=1 Tax=Protopolystoma xenopodis TaxID=117903 RepID=A0A3S5FH58_9PLAT|nr:unnamed protein product [Protopolystoma xenopodis]
MHVHTRNLMQALRSFDPLRNVITSINKHSNSPIAQNHAAPSLQTYRNASISSSANVFDSDEAAELPSNTISVSCGDDLLLDDASNICNHSSRHGINDTTPSHTKPSNQISSTVDVSTDSIIDKRYTLGLPSGLQSSSLPGQGVISAPHTLNSYPALATAFMAPNLPQLRPQWEFIRSLLGLARKLTRFSSKEQRSRANTILPYFGGASFLISLSLLLVFLLVPSVLFRLLLCLNSSVILFSE